MFIDLLTIQRTMVLGNYVLRNSGPKAMHVRDTSLKNIFTSYEKKGDNFEEKENLERFMAMVDTVKSKGHDTLRLRDLFYEGKMWSSLIEFSSFKMFPDVKWSPSDDKRYSELERKLQREGLSEKEKDVFFIELDNRRRKYYQLGFQFGIESTGPDGSTSFWVQQKNKGDFLDVFALRAGGNPEPLVYPSVDLLLPLDEALPSVDGAIEQMLEATVDMEALLEEGWKDDPSVVSAFHAMLSRSRSYLENPDTPHKGENVSNFKPLEGLEPPVLDWYPTRAFALSQAWSWSQIYGRMGSFNDLPPRHYKGDWEKYHRILDQHTLARDTAVIVACSACP